MLAVEKLAIFQRKCSLFLATIAFLFPTASMCQINDRGYEAANGENTPSCEIRIFTSEKFEIMDSTDFPGGGIIGAGLSGLYGKESLGEQIDFASKAVSPSIQKNIISKHIADNAFLFKTSEIFYNSTNIKFLDMYYGRKSLARLSTSKNECYSEIITNMRYVRTSLYRKVASTFIFRDFGNRALPKKVFWLEKTGDAKAFLGKSEISDEQRTGSFVQLFESSFTGFLLKLTK